MSTSKKTTLLLAVLTLYLGFTAAALDITEFEISPENPGENEDVEITARADTQANPDGTRPDVYFIRLLVDGERIDTKNCGGARGETDYSCSQTFTHSFDEGEREIEIYARDSSFDSTSKTEKINVGEGKDEGLKLEDVFASNYNVKPGGSTTLKADVETGNRGRGINVQWRADSEVIGSTSNFVSSNSEKTFERTRTFRQLKNSGLKEGECYSFEADLLSEDIEITESSSQDLCLNKEDEEDEEEEDVRADFTYRPSNPETGETVTFDASNSEGNIEEYSWSFSDDESAEGVEVSRPFESSGSYSATLTVEGESSEDSMTKTFWVSSRAVESSGLNVEARDQDNEPLRNVKITAMNWGPSDFQVISTSKTDSSGDSSKNKGDSRIGFELENDELTTYAEYHSGYSRRAWNNLALVSSGEEDELIFRYDLAADKQQSSTREYRAEQSIEAPEGDKKVTVLLTLNGEKVSSFTSRITVPDEHEFSKVKDSSGTTYNGKDRRVMDSPSLPSYTRYTGLSGETFFDIPAGRYTVTGTKSGYSSDRETITLDEGETENVNLQLEEFEREQREEEEDEPQDPGNDKDPENDEGSENGDEDRDEKETENSGQDRISINSVSLPASVCRGDDAHVRVTVENTRGEDRSFALSGTGLSSDLSRVYYLDKSEVATKVLTFPSVEGSGNQKVSISTGYDSIERTIQVRNCETEERDMSVSVSPTELREGQTVRVSGILEGSGSREVDISVAGVHRQSVSTRPDGRFNTYVRPPRTGSQEVLVESQGVSRTRNINVLPDVNIYSLDAPDSVFEDESFRVCGEVESSTSSLVLFKKDGEVLESRNGRGNVCFDRTEKPGNYKYEIQALNQGASSSASKEVRVYEQDSQVRSFPDRVASVESGSNMVKVDLYNNNPELRSYELELEGLPKDWVSQSRKEVTLNKGERKTEYFYVSPKRSGDFEAVLNVRSGGEQIYSENVKIKSGGTDRRESLWQRVVLWFRYG